MNLFSLNNIVSGSETEASKAIYGKLNAKLVKWSEWFNFASMKVTLPALTLPNIIKSFFIYFTTDDGADAFQLPFYAW